jgi:Ca2+-binding RTX toxin-like protein
MTLVITREAGADDSSAGAETPPSALTVYASAEAASNPERPYEWQLDGYLTPGSNAFGANVDLISTEYSGAGVRVGLIDEGFDITHPDLAGRFDLSTSYDPRDGAVINIRPDSSSAVHGTWVAGVLGAGGDDDFGMIGVAPDATLVGYYARFGLGGSLRAEMADLLARQVNVDVSNNSWGYTTQFADNFLDPSWAQIKDALQLGVTEGRDGLGTVYVFAAGNDRQYVANSLAYDGDNTNYHNLTNSRSEITVAASTPDGHIAPFSTPGASVLVTAPGVAVLTTMLVHGDPADAFGFVSGTSIATPIVSGVVAMMLEANPDLGYRDVQEILAISARMIDPASASWATNGATNWNGGGHEVSHDFGFGLVDAHAAVRLAETWTTQHTAANEAVIDAAGTVADGALTDFLPRSYTVTVAPDFATFSIDWVEVDVSFLHSYAGDLRVHLISPTGTDSLLLDQPGAGTNARSNLQFTFSTDHDWGESPAGTWTLVVEDAGTGGTGSLQSFGLHFYGDDEGNNNTYYYTDDFATLAGDRTTLTDAAGNDTINAAAVTTDLFVDLTPGATSMIAGRAVLIDSGTVIENVYGGDGNDTLIGNDAGNRLYGGHGDDTLQGGAGDDTLVGGAGADSMAGGTGNDIYFVDNAGDLVFENANEGIDTVNASISYTLGANLENLTLTDDGGAIDGTGNALDNVIIGNASANVLVGAEGDDTLDGGAGADTLIGGIGNDTYRVDNVGDVVVENASEGTDTVIASIDYVLPDNVENLTLAEGAGAIKGTGNSLSNTIIGNSSNNVLDGGAGGLDTLIGGSGDDTYYVHDASTTVVEDAGGGADTVIADVDYELPANVETLILTGAAIHGAVLGASSSFSTESFDPAAAVTGDDTGKVMVANSAIASSLMGGMGNDLLVGVHAVASDLAGGLGNDSYVVFNANDRVDESAGAGSDTIYARVDFALPENVETLFLLGSATHGTGNDSGSVLVANPDQSSTLVGGAGSDLFVGAHSVASTMIGGGGDDIYVIFNSNDVVDENANGGNDTIYARADYTLSANVETLYLVDSATHGTANDDGATLVANGALSSVLTGGAGNDLFVGSHGAASILSGGAGDDTYVIFNSNDAIAETSGGGNDTVYSLADYVLPDNVETLYLVGSASHGGANEHGATLVANSQVDSTLAGGAGDDLLVGRATSTSTMMGGDGNDTYVVFNSADIIREQPGAGADTVVTYADYTLPDNVETLILHPGAGAINGTGGAANNAIIGNGSANIIDGGGGADVLIGNGGGDTFVFHAGEANGDVVKDFDAHDMADHLLFVGYGSEHGGASLAQLDDTHWSVNSADGRTHDIVTFSNAAAISAHDFLFA